MACPAPRAAPGCLAHADGDSTRVRVQVLTNAGALDRDKQPPVISQAEAPTADGAWPATPPPTPSSPKAGAEIASLQPRTGN